MRPALKIYNNVTELIGNTPLVNLSRLSHLLNLPPGSRLLAKLEYLNPGHSKKDRIGLSMIEEAEKEGKIRPGDTVIELTSGNTGTGLAIVCSVKGYKYIAVMSEGNSTERAKMMRALGAEVILVPQTTGGVKGKVSGEDILLIQKKTEEITAERKAFRADQFTRKGNYLAHYNHTGKEILYQTDNNIDAFCDFLGTGGTFLGISMALKERNKNIKCFIVEPEGAAVLGDGFVTNTSHRIQGGGYAIPKEKLQLHLTDTEGIIDGYIKIKDTEAIEMARLLAKHEGIFGGFSSGCNVAAAVQLLKGSFAGKTVVCLICDSGLKYLSTDLWETSVQCNDPTKSCL